MATKKKYIVLNIQQRLDVLKDLQEASLSISKVGKKYGVDVKTIQRIKKNAARINAFADKSKREKKRRKIIGPVYDELDKCLLAWCEERRKNCELLTDALMLNKARELKDNLPSCSRCKVSRGWLTNFKRRHSIRLVHVDMEEASADEDCVNTFVDDFKKLVQEQNINEENIYNMDESGLVWKALPTKAFAGDEKNLGAVKFPKDRITIGLCTNAVGTHKIMPLVIYRYKNPRALKHEVSLPVTFKSQVDARMDRRLFLDWYENHFKPSVREYQDEKQLSGKVILLIDNCEGHLISPEVQKDENFKIMYFPPNTTPLIQPMNQGIMGKTKRLYRHKILQRALTYGNKVNEFYEDYSIKNCVDMLSQSWSEITQSNIRNAWNQIIGPIIPSSHVKSATELQPDWQNMMSVITGEKCTQQQVTEFLSVCEEVEIKTEEEQIKEETVNEEEPLEEPHEVIYQEHDNEIARNELRRIFEQLTVYSTRAPTYIQCITQGLKIFFLGKED